MATEMRDRNVISNISQLFTYIISLILTTILQLGGSGRDCGLPKALSEFRVISTFELGMSLFAAYSLKHQFITDQSMLKRAFWSHTRAVELPDTFSSLSLSDIQGSKN